MQFPAFLRVIRSAAVFAVLLASVSTGIADAQSARDRVRRLDEEAIAAFHELDLDRAEALLAQAFELATTQHVDGRELARIHLTRGVVAVAGHGDNARGVDSFMAALNADPTIELDPMTSTPEVQSAFATAQARSAAGGRAGTTSVARDASTASTTSSSASTTTSTTSTTSPASTTASEPAPECRADSDCGGGEGCDEGRCVSRVQRPRFFLQAGGVFGVYRATSGMLADGRPPSGGDPARYAGYVMGGAPGCDAPSGSYCVRVTNPGILPVFGVRAAFGYWVSSRVALALTVRLGLGGGQSPLSYGTVGGRVQVMVTNPDATRFALSLFVGGAIGQVQVRPRQSSTTPGVHVVEPWAQAGLASVQVGAIGELTLTRHFGLFVQVDASAFFKEFNVGVDVSAGPEVLF